ncbi:MAG: hypothetical protein ACRDZY_22335, partial [Acidimicrobiales bacterium]
VPPGQPLPPGMDADEYRRFQEFQRFQDFQRFTEAQRQAGGPAAPGGALVPVPPPGQPVPQARQGPTDIHQHLAGMSQQIAELSASQARVERVVNPPTWKKVLRNKWLHRLAWLVVLAAVAVWGVPLLVEHFFGNSDQTSGGSPHPGPPQEKHIYTQGALNTVHYTYDAIAHNDPANNAYARLMCETFGQQARTSFADAAGVPASTGSQQNRCQQAVLALHQQVSAGSGSGDLQQPYLTLLAEPAASQSEVAYSACPVESDTAPPGLRTAAGVPVLGTFTVAGGPALGTFTISRGTGDDEWFVSDYSSTPTCPAQPPTTSTAPTP